MLSRRARRGNEHRALRRLRRVGSDRNLWHVHVGTFGLRGVGIARGYARSVLHIVLVRWRWFRGGLWASRCWSLGYQPLRSLVAALVGHTGNDRRRGRRAVFFEPDRLSRKPGNPSNEVRWIRLADPSWRPLARNAPSYRSSVPKSGNSMTRFRLRW